MKLSNADYYIDNFKNFLKIKNNEKYKQKLIFI